MDIESKIISRILSEFPQGIMTKYDMDESNFTTSGNNNTDAIFPTIYVHALAPVEQAEDLENNKINSALYTIQIDVYDSSDMEVCKIIMDEVTKIMKSMRFRGISLAESDYQSSVCRQIARFRRLVGNDDTF